MYSKNMTTNLTEWPVVFRSKKSKAMGSPGSILTKELTAGLHPLKGNARPYFSFTVWSSDDSGGAAHELIEDVWPEIKEFLPLHLADENGKPMHAYENGCYWFGMTEYQEFDAEKAARHFRDTPENMVLIKERIEAGETNLLSEYVAGCKERWKHEADKCIEFLRAQAND